MVFERLYEECDRLDRLGRVSESIALLSSAILSAPSAKLYYERGIRLEASGNLDKALEDLDSAIALECTLKYQLVRAGLIYRKSPSMAAVAFQSILEEYPGNENALKQLFLCYRLLGDEANALRCASDLAKMCADDAEAQTLLGEFFFAKGDLLLAQTWLTKATQRNPTLSAGWMALGRLRRKLGDLQGAKSAMQKAIDLDIDPHFQLSYSSLLLELGEYDRASEILLQINDSHFSEAQKFLLYTYKIQIPPTSGV